MAKNKGKGGSGRRKGKNGQDEMGTARELLFKEDGQGYGYLNKTLGNGRFEVFCDDGVTRLGILRGKLRKKIWFVAGDVVLHGMRDFQAAKIDIFHKYTSNEVENLYEYEEVPRILYNMYKNDVHGHDQTGENGESDIEFSGDDVDAI